MHYIISGQFRMLSLYNVCFLYNTYTYTQGIDTHMIFHIKHIIQHSFSHASTTRSSKFADMHDAANHKLPNRYI